MLFLKILAGVVAIGVGVYLGRPRRYDRSQDEVERALQSNRTRRQWTKRHFTPLDMLRKSSRGSVRRRAEQGRFQTVAPKRPPADGDRDAGSGPAASSE